MMLTHDPATTDPAPSRFSGMRMGLLTAVTLFAAAVPIGFATSVLRRQGGFDRATALTEAAMIGVALACAAFWRHMWRRERRSEGPVSARVRRARQLMAICTVAGLPAGYLLAAHGRGHSFAGPLPVWVALAVIAITLLLIPVTWAWYKASDELERSAYDRGMSAGAHLFAFGAPVWWLAWRGGLAPEPQGVTLYFLVMLLGGVVWLWRRAG